MLRSCSSAPAALCSTLETIAIGSICDQPGCGVVVADCSSTWGGDGRTFDGRTSLQK
jgi:hypothetical protein